MAPASPGPWKALFLFVPGAMANQKRRISIFWFRLDFSTCNQTELDGSALRFSPLHRYFVEILLPDPFKVNFILISETLKGFFK